MKIKLILIALLLLGSCTTDKTSPWNKMLPEYELKFPALARTWDEGIPLGNATIGALIWQNEDALRFSLDRADLWDLRPMANLDFENYDFKWVLEQWHKNTYEKVQQKYDAPYDNLPAPSKIPAAALEFNSKKLGEIASVTLSLKNALCTVKWKNGTQLTTFVHATEPIGWYRFENLTQELSPVIIAPSYVSIKTAGPEDPVTGKDLRRLEYPGGKIISTKNSHTYVQKGWNDFSYEVHTEWIKEGTTLEGSWSISSKKTETEVTATAKETIAANSALNDKGNLLASHKKWWTSFWSKSSISIPDTILQNQWYMEMYKLGAAARKGAPPISLQSVWTADNGKLPPWKGDFHHDLNTQLSYWPTYSGNHLDLEEGFIDWLEKYKPTFKKYTAEYYNTTGINVPGVSTLTGDPMGGWIQYAFGPTVSAWLGQHYYLHWRYSMDRDFLTNKAYPWIKDVAIHLDELSVLDANGKRKLPLSSSPEIHNNARNAWFDSMSNFDLALVRWTFEKASELASELGKKDEAEKWKKIGLEWPDYAVNEDGLMFTADLPFNSSHRHFSHLMAIHPLGLLDYSNGKQQQQIIDKTIANLDKTGSSQWVGYSFSWLGNLKARAFDGEGAAKALKDFATSFVLPNSFHVNGDQSGTGKSNFTYRPFTLEGNFAFAAGIQEMLIQSHTGIVKLFPAIPKNWKEVSFQQLRTEGAFLISAKKEKGSTTFVQILSEKGGTIKLENPFTTKELEINGSESYTWNDGVLEIVTKPKAIITIH
ncbi:hypothetical protein MWU65_03795 [Cellulophaga sp. F20128]|uniref:glycosyl hydrolase family 95 catalytic domain-containing protein n=1 Tax=Cellulophaga sp. F20128 TaxID=2926413 RepID=UPI001FF69E89|nr:hypothetical protein [Cellulophaga sp. F20128]MCK0156287.1 hypothetical protein [Cellulophaga sp. F20128]